MMTSLLHNNNVIIQGLPHAGLFTPLHYVAFFFDVVLKCNTTFDLFNKHHYWSACEEEPKYFYGAIINRF